MFGSKSQARGPSLQLLVPATIALGLAGGEPPSAQEPGRGLRTFEYAAKLVCGRQQDPERMQIVRGFYATAINIHNPNNDFVRLRKKLALTFPPEEEAPGKVLRIADHELGPDDALEVDCEDVRREAFGGEFPAPWIKGFVVVQSQGPLDVTAVYTAARLDGEGNVDSVSSIDVETIRGRRMGGGGPRQCPDLTVTDIGSPSVNCPTGGGSCVTKVEYTVANIGNADAGPFDVRAILDPNQSVVVDSSVSMGLDAGTSETIAISTPPGGNCFDPDCTITVRADFQNAVDECNENNNQASETTPG